jgi:serine/threonine-protein phosphatase 2B regulatory subunit
MDRDGFISNGELYLVLKQMVGNNLKVCPAAFPLDPELMSRTSNYNRSSTRRSWRPTRMGMLSLPPRTHELMIRDGKLNFQEFAAMVENTDIVKLVLHHTRDPTNM